MLELLPPTFTRAEALAAGVGKDVVYGLRNAGELLEVSRGVYRKASAPETAHVDLLAAAKRAPRAVVCLVSALSLHELTDEIPSAVQMALPRGVNIPHITYPPVEFSQFDPRTFDLGREMFEASPGELVPVYGPERTVADAMRLRHLIGDTIALHALRIYLTQANARPGDLALIGRQLGDAGPLLEAIKVVLG